MAMSEWHHKRFGGFGRSAEGEEREASLCPQGDRVPLADLACHALYGIPPAFPPEVQQYTNTTVGDLFSAKSHMDICNIICRT